MKSKLGAIGGEALHSVVAMDGNKAVNHAIDDGSKSHGGGLARYCEDLTPNNRIRMDSVHRLKYPASAVRAVAITLALELQGDGPVRKGCFELVHVMTRSEFARTCVSVCLYVMYVMCVNVCMYVPLRAQQSKGKDANGCHRLYLIRTWQVHERVAINNHEKTQNQRDSQTTHSSPRFWNGCGRTWHWSW